MGVTSCFFLVLIGLLCSPVVSQNCWVGTSDNTSITGYPPVSETCDQSGFVCQLEKTKPNGYYILLCSTSAVCQAILNDMTSNPSGSIDTEVICCNNDNCNYYPGQAGTPGSSGNTERGNVLLSLVCVASLALNVALQYHHHVVSRGHC